MERKELKLGTRYTIAVGQVFNWWLVLDVPAGLTGRLAYEAGVLCRCRCGLEKHVNAYHLARGKSSRCRSCRARTNFTTHGESDCGGSQKGERLYRLWKAMKWRCNPKNQSVDGRSYCRRGISVCEEWAESYTAFRDWALANGYRDDLTLDRRDNNRGYGPDNCRFATYTQQARNTRRSRMLTAFGETKTLPEWAEDSRCACSHMALHQRIWNGWPHEEAIKTPHLSGAEKGRRAVASRIANQKRKKEPRR